MTVVVKEAPEGELVESVLGVLAVAKPAVEGVVVVVLAVAIAAPHFVRVHGVEVGCVRRVSNGRDVRRQLLPLVAGEVGGLEERVSFDFVCAVLAEAVLGAAAQFNNEIRRLGAELGLLGNMQRSLPVYYLVSTVEET